MTNNDEEIKDLQKRVNRMSVMLGIAYGTLVDAYHANPTSELKSSIENMERFVKKEFYD